MQNETFLSNESIIITIDVDSFLFERLRQITQAGFQTIEINSTDPTLLQKIMKEFPKLHLGAGNITTTQQLENAYQANVHFATSPGFLPAIAQTAAIYSMNYLPGIATLSEAMQIMALGYQQARPYPSSLSFCTLVNKCLPTLRLFPAEIEKDETEHYLSLPAVSTISILNPDKTQLNALSLGIVLA
ncbi:MAG: multidrug DMT transporter permease [Legionellales bacterium RIFCSPHIGHO2_12_FULL_42_9]|nr:MAG: multidrug DMT transporter permease [Legionellales bacterium RIFCSPHIGHO2_12_FULL_42_9]